MFDVFSSEIFDDDKSRLTAIRFGDLSIELEIVSLMARSTISFKSDLGIDEEEQLEDGRLT